MEHFDVVGEALLTSLSDVFGEAFNAKTRDVWTRVYGVVVQAMLEGNDFKNIWNKSS